MALYNAQKCDYIGLVKQTNTARDSMRIDLNPARHEPLYIQISDQIRQSILQGALRPGERLEPSRELARRLGVHRTTVGNAYASLEEEGLIHGAVGRGTFVRQSLPDAAAAAPAAPPGSRDFFWDTFLAQEAQDDSFSRLVAASGGPGVISFAVTHGAEELAPVAPVRHAMDAVLRREGAQLLQYGSSDGYPPFKEFVREQLRRDGIIAAEDEILITSGCQQSLDLIRRSLTAPGEAVACENPTYPGLSNLFDSSSARLIGIPVGRTGMDLNFLASVLEQNRVKLIVTTPNFQNPTGVTQPLEARQQLLQLASRHQAAIVEDDIYGALRFSGPPVPPLRALDQTGRVIYLNSFSKTGFPGLRVGWIAAGRRVVERLRWAKQRSDVHTNLLGQAVLAELGRRGWLDKLLRQTRKLYGHRQQALQQAMQGVFPPEARCFFPPGGMSVWAEMPEGADSMALLARTRERGVTFAPSSYFYFQNVRQNALRLCYSPLDDAQIQKGVQILCELMQEEIRRAQQAATRKPASAMAMI